MERLVVALGGNALLKRGEDDTPENLRRSARFAAERVADIAQAGWEVVVTHGNGPQVGRILLQQEAAREWGVAPMPLDICGAESQGQIGYLLQATIGDVFYEREMERPVTTVLTMTRVHQDDPAFHRPTKPIGPYYRDDDARRLVADGVVVISAGGGGVPVYEDGPRLTGLEGVVDKDLAAAILARDVEASVLLILTDVEGVYRDYGTDNAELLKELRAEDARAMLEAGEFGEGSMGPKVEAAIEFVTGGGDRALIASLEEASTALSGNSGTTIIS